MGGFATLLADVLLLKGFAKPDAPDTVDCARAAKRLGFRKDELYRYLYKDRAPGDEAKRKIVNQLELDGNFVLETGSKRFADMTTAQALTHMALDRYLETHDVEEADAQALRYLADHHNDPPLWSKVWEQNHTSWTLMKKRQPSGSNPTRSRSFKGRRVGVRQTPNA